jgi:hypothetical protein
MIAFIRFLLFYLLIPLTGLIGDLAESFKLLFLISDYMNFNVDGFISLR